MTVWQSTDSLGAALTTSGAALAVAWTLSVAGAWWSARRGLRRECARLRQQQEALLEEGSRLREEARSAHREMINGLEAIIWERRTDTGEFVSVSRHATSLLGHPVEQWTSDPAFWIRILHTEDRARVLAAVDALARDGGERTLEYRLMAEDGWAIWVRDSIRAVRGIDGRVKCLRGMAVSVMESKRAEQALRESESRYRSLYEGLPVGIYRTNAQGQFLAANPTLLQMIGYTDLRELRSIGEHELYADALAHQRSQKQLQGDGSVRNIEALLRRRDGTTMWVRKTARAVYDSKGQVVHYEGTLEDITDRKLAEEAERAAEAKFRSLVEQALVGTFIIQAGKLVYANPKMCEIFGYEAREMLALGSFLEFVDERDRRSVAAHLEHMGSAEATSDIFTFRGRRSDGSAINVEVHNARIQFRGAPALIGTLMDITRRKEMEDKLVHTALHDVLTGLPNRLLFTERLEHAVARTRRAGGQAFAVLFLDLDRFKVINDSLGHHVGDELLVTVAHRLQTCLRPGDTVARLGGDEFGVLLEGVQDVTEAIRVAERIAMELSTPLVLGEYEVYTSTSIGIVLSSPTFDRPEHLLRSADMAMYRAKAAGQGRYEVFDRAMHAEALARLQLETDLRRAVEREEFRLHYQPIVSLDNGMIAGFEALARWEHPERGMISPAEFIPVAEETGMIIPLGRWILREACQRLKDWQGRFPRSSPLSVGVNLSVRQFLQPDLLRDINQALEESGLDPRSLKLEITESMIMENSESAATVLRRMRQLGIQLYLDDFGTGYSSLSHLHRLPLDTLKIDRSFVGRIGEDHRDSHLVSTIVQLAHNLGVQVVSEGVETREQLSALRALGCEYGQGYLLSRPLSAQHAEDLLGGAAPWMEFWQEPGGVGPKFAPIHAR